MRWSFFKKIAWLLIIAAFIAAYYLTPLAHIIEPAQSALARLGGVFWQAGRKAKNRWDSVAHGREYRKMYAKIADENTALLAENARLKSYQNENSQLRSLLEFKEKNNLYRQVAATVLGASSLSGRRVLLIDRGWEDGLVENLAVVNPAGILVGKTEQVKTRISRVVLTTDSQSTLAAQLANNSKVQGVLRGKSGLTLSFELIPSSETLHAGELVASSILEDNTPSGLLIGRIASVEYREGELFKKALVAPLANFADLQTVSVILPGEP